MANSSSPIRSPFQNIANCVAKVFQWSNKDEVEKDKSRSVSPEIPKLEEPRQFTMQEENMEPSPARNTRRSSRCKTPQTPRAIARTLDFNEDDSLSPKKNMKTTTRRSLRVRTTPAKSLQEEPLSPEHKAVSRPRTPRVPKTASQPSTPSRSKTEKREEPKTPKGTPSRSRTEKKVEPTTPENKIVTRTRTPRSTRSESRPQTPIRGKNESASGTPKRGDSRPQTPTRANKPEEYSVTRTPKGTLKLKRIENQEEEQEMTPTRRSSRAKKPSPKMRSDEDSDDDFKPETPSKRPNTPRGKSVRALGFTKDEELNSHLMKTPKRRKTSIEAVAHRDTPAKRRRTMTPRIPARSVPLAKDKSSLEEAQLRLHVGAVPDSLPCREDEFAQILSFAEGKIFDGTGGCMYISGVPGTGKTATVKEVIRTLQTSSDEGELPEFKFIEINGMRLTEPNQLYAQLWKALTGAKVTTEHAKNLLEKRFTAPTSAKKSQTTVVLVDELDLLWNRKQSVLYNIFEWPNSPSAKLVILAIANTMDLPERVMINRVSSRIGLTRLTFSPYTHEQLQEIVTARLSGLSVFDKDAIQLVARKVASLSGDARRALDICRRATEIAQRQGQKTLVTIQHVTEAHKEMFCSPKIQAIRRCSKYEKVFLQSIVGVFQKIGIEEAPFERVIKAMAEVLKFENLDMLSVDEAHNVVGRLTACRLVLAEPGKTGRLDMKLRLNVSQDDVLFALKNDQ